MLDLRKELVLKLFFYVGGIFEENVLNNEKLIDICQKIFLLSDDEIKDVSAGINAQEIVDIKNIKDFNLYSRMKQFSEINGYNMDIDSSIEEMIELKGYCLSTLEEKKLAYNNSRSRRSIIELLVHTANEGDISACCVLGFLYMSGCLLEKNMENGMKYLRMAADWHSLMGLFEVLFYDVRNREKYLPRIKYILLSEGEYENWNLITRIYGNGDKVEPDYLLEKIFNINNSLREKYNFFYAKILYSPILSQKDKEYLLLSNNVDSLNEASKLPLNIQSNAMAFIYDASDRLFNRNKDIIKKLSEIGNPRNKLNKPLCILSESKIELKNCANKLKDCFSEAHVEQIEVEELTDIELDNTIQNVFIKSCYDNKNNLFILLFQKALDEQKFEKLKNFLQTSKRKKFFLKYPNISIDLSSVAIVCLCLKSISSKLESLCEMIELNDMCEEDKWNFIQTLMQEKKQMYHITDVIIEEKIKERFMRYSLDKIEEMIDKLFCKNKYNAVYLTEDTLIQENVQKYTGYGFGGDIYEVLK